MPENKKKPGWGHPKPIDVLQHYYFKPDDISNIFKKLGHSDTDTRLHQSFCEDINFLAQSHLHFIRNPPPSGEGVRQSLESLASKGEKFISCLDEALSTAQSGFEALEPEIKAGFNGLTALLNRTQHYLKKCPNAGMIGCQTEQDEWDLSINWEAGLEYLDHLLAMSSVTRSRMLPALTNIKKVLKPVQESGDEFINCFELLDNRSFVCLEYAFHTTFIRAVYDHDFNTTHTLYLVNDKELFTDSIKALNEKYLSGLFESDSIGISTVLDEEKLSDEIGDIIASAQSGGIRGELYGAVKSKINTIIKLTNCALGNKSSERDNPQQHFDQLLTDLEAQFNQWFKKIEIYPLSASGAYFERYQSQPGNGYCGELLEALRYCLLRIAPDTLPSRDFQNKTKLNVRQRDLNFIAKRLQEIATKSKKILSNL